MSAGSPAPGADTPSLEQVSRNLALANRILARQNVVDTFGHVSQRSPFRPDRVFIARSLAPERVMPDDIVEIALDGQPPQGGAPGSYIERFIHTEIYRARPDVNAVVHSHSASVLPFSVVPSAPMRCVCHTAGFIGTDVPIFEIRDTGGDATDLLVSTPTLGRELAAQLGDKPIILMRGHGSTVVGATLRQAVFRAVYAEVNAQVQLKAQQLGPVTFLSEAEARVATSTDAAYNRAWDLWTAQAAPSLQATAG